ncbi:PKD domain-containing protein [Actinacidiphila reveromycinica]|uniref:PKD domain-containing protein n=1 Tax=Actinacidiphila reveromycinica TaxID=659352 RepID=UPI001920D0AB|nr:PKD domain-containing protein [Streptomyces sp. SN-593]
MVGVAVLSLLVGGGFLPGAELTASADTGTRYVDIQNASCSDTAAGTGTQAQPYCTLQAAVDAAQPGDTVVVSGYGDYPATTVTSSGTSDAPLTIEGNFRVAGLTFAGVHDVALRDGTMMLSAGSIRVQDSDDVTIDKFNLNGAEDASVIAVSGSSSDVTISRNNLLPVDKDNPVISVGVGVRRTVVTTNDIDEGEYADRDIALDGAVDTAVTSNNLGGLADLVAIDGASTGTTVENNGFDRGRIEVGADSTATTTIGYNLYYPRAGGAVYGWAGTDYTEVASFQTATGQGGHDIVGGTAGGTSGFQWYGEGNPGIDSADANAPGELSTDILGFPRVDDTLTPNTGTGPGYFDRGANEQRNPFSVGYPTASPNRIAVGATVTVTPHDVNPWGTTVSRTYDFGDGTPPLTSTAASVRHTYTKLPGSGDSFVITVDTDTPPGALAWERQLVEYVSPQAPFTAKIAVLALDASTPLAVHVRDDAQGDPFELGSCRIDFGDGTPAVTQDYSCEDQHTYAKAGTYTVHATESDLGGRTSSTTAEVTVGPVFVSTSPSRILDTRTGLGAPKAQVAAGKVVHLKANGAGPVANATSVLLNVTVTRPTVGGHITAYPGGASQPTSSIINYAKGQTAANLVTVPIGPDGTVSLSVSAGSADLVADVEGYTTLTPEANDGSVLHDDGGLIRVLDTRGDKTNGLPALGKVAPHSSLTFTALRNIGNANSAEYGATAVVLDLVETGATSNSYVTAYRPGDAVPTASNLNFGTGETRAAMVVVPVDTNGRVSLYNNAGSVDLIASVEGVYVPFGPTTEPFNKPLHPIAPVRVLDTRSGTGGHKGALASGSTLQVRVGGTAGIPSDVTGVLVNLTAVTPSANGHLTADDPDEFNTSPGASTLNFMAGRTTAVLAYVPCYEGRFTLHNAQGAVNAVADIEGYYTS